MTEIEILLDYPNSIATSYHVLHAQEPLSLRHNKTLRRFMAKEVDHDDVANYQSILRDLDLFRKGKRSEDERILLCMSECETATEYYSKKGIPADDPRLRRLEESAHRFEQAYKPLWQFMTSRVYDKLEERTDLLEDVYEDLYEVASYYFPGEELMKPTDVQVRLVIGLAPTSFVGHPDPDDYVIFEQVENYKDPDWFLKTFVHELLPHSVAAPYRSLHKPIFGSYKYDLEEGFAKLATDMILDDLISTSNHYKSSLDHMEGSYHTYKERWGSVRRMPFKEWYEMCLKQLKEEGILEKKSW